MLEGKASSSSTKTKKGRHNLHHVWRIGKWKITLHNFDLIAYSGDTEDFSVFSNDPAFVELFLMFPNVNCILVPKKAAYTLKKYVPKKVLIKIHPNPKVAVEKCLLILSNLASTYYTDDKWKSLNSEILHEQTKERSNTYIYKTIIEVLCAGTKNGPFLEVDHSYQEGVGSKKYKIGDVYLKAGLTDYILTDRNIIQTRNKLYFEQLVKAMTNQIASNLIKLYPRLEMPTAEQLLEIGKRLVKEGRLSKKGKKLTMRNKHQNQYWKDHGSRSYIEDNIQLYQFLTHRGFMIPIEGGDKSGGRIVDSFVLMPSWIREQITVDGHNLIEADYVALHPNIAMAIYGGKSSYLNHQKVADALGLDTVDVKIDHLSFFNSKIGQMKQSPLYDYYKVHEPEMLVNLEKDKRKNGYKVTSRKLFKAEVEIMTEVVRKLNSKGIYVLYIYDALMCTEKDYQDVCKVMNEVSLSYGVKTEVKDIL